VTLGASEATTPVLLAGIARSERRPVLVVVAKQSRARDLVEELSAWLGAEAERLHLYPERDALPYERAPADAWAAAERLRALAALAGATDAIVIASAAGLAAHTLPPAALRAARRIEVGTRLDPEELLRHLLEAGYESVPLVEAPGQVARRGGIVDVFPPGEAAPARVELFGEEVESIRAFDPESQRSLERRERLELGPAAEWRPGPARAASLLASLDFTGSEGNEEAGAVREELEALAEGRSVEARSFLPSLLSEHSLADHLPGDALVVVEELTDVRRAVEELAAEALSVRTELEERGRLPRGLPLAVAGWREIERALRDRRLVEVSRFGTEEAGAVRPPFGPAAGYAGRVRALARDAAAASRRGEYVVIVSQQSGRLRSVLVEEGAGVETGESVPAGPAPGSVFLLRGSLSQGWVYRGAETVTLLTDAEVFGFAKQRRVLRAPAGDRSRIVADLSPGDYVVHVEHGIARFGGLVTRRLDDTEREYLELHYAEGDRLFVPVDQADRVARHVGSGEHHPHLTRLGSGEWARVKERVRRAVADLARELLELYAAREVLAGHAFSPDSPWQRELEASFPYVETPDQLATISDVKRDMESARPMDRLICGDVGFGKTEVAIRAAFKAVMDGFQVAVLVPTTVLAQQHFTTFRERLASFPVRVEMLSRFLSDRQQREVVREVGDGAVDIVIGTHRLLQRDVVFRKLGLVIIDEEQRFGVAHKERLKQMRREVDVLTLSATPIPRTLHMSLAGIRDISNMLTPPEDRSPIRTYVLESDDLVIREAIRRELERGGQVFFVHNRVYNIELVAARIRNLVPEARVEVGHGQMPEEKLERTMLQFAHGEIDVLVCTTIIESGLDIPNANTIIINQADKLGLAQLYQLRGRVGRGPVRAYAYLLYNRGLALSETAQKRLQAIFEATELGGGFQIAVRDLEIRGAGNLLGAEQSGHILAVGFDLYVRLLAEAVERLKAVQRGEQAPPPPPPAATLDLPLTAYLPDAYVPDLNLRLALYQRLAHATDEADLAAVQQELLDRFGPLPPPARNLIWVVGARLLASVAGVQSIQTEEGKLVLRLRPGREIDRQAFARRVPAGSWVGSHQVRLDRAALGEGWQEALVRVLDAMRGAALPAAASS
jgi:transcription-repair coupling factor (superfamily II helicase)